MKQKNVISPARDRLLKLYIPGKEVTFEDENGEFSVWLQKINTWQERDAVQKSKISRAPIMALKRDLDNPDRYIYEDLLEKWGYTSREIQIKFFIGPKLQEARDSAEARIAYEDEWKNDDYLNTLQEAWNGGLAERFTLDQDDVEAKRVFSELYRYTQQVDSAVEHEEKELIASYSDYSDEKVYEKAIDFLIEREADAVQIEEFRRWQMFYAARSIDDHDEMFFVERSDLDAIDPSVYERLVQEYIDMIFEGLEGKE